MIDNNKLEEKLYEVVASIYTSEHTYLVIESLEEYIDEDNENKFSIFIKGRYGREKENAFCEHFEIQIQPEWTYEFIEGYFCRYIEEQME